MFHRKRERTDTWMLCPRATEGNCRYSDVVWSFLKLTCNYIFLQHDLISIHVFDNLFSSYCMFMFVFSERIWLNLNIIRVSCGGKFFCRMLLLHSFLNLWRFFCPSL